MTSKPPLKSENSRSKIEPQKSKEELLKAKNDPQKVKNEPQKSDLQKPKEEPKKFKVEPLKSKVEPPKSKIEQPKEVKVEAPKPKPESQKANKQKKKVEFNKTEVYLFEVREGLDAIPTTGGIPLGMEHKHHDKQEFSCTQFEKMHAVKTPQKSVDESTQSTEENPSTSPFKMKERFEPLSHDARKGAVFL
ncbi:CSRNP-N domain-containing protein [Aphelenchoides bicaudatus]|nr:CSRNP-N domain-containing protein [Aphelenchoides bicaudatus]